MPQRVLCSQPVCGHGYRYILAFGSNLGERFDNLEKGIASLSGSLFLLRQTRWRKTAPLPHPVFDVSDHGEYVNFVCEAFSQDPPEQLYLRIAAVEDSIGHSRERKWLPRALDIDLLFCAQNDATRFEDCAPYAVSAGCGLQIPHPDYPNRHFWQEMVEGELGLSSSWIARCLSLVATGSQRK